MNPFLLNCLVKMAFKASELQTMRKMKLHSRRILLCFISLASTLKGDKPKINELKNIGFAMCKTFEWDIAEL